MAGHRTERWGVDRVARLVTLGHLKAPEAAKDMNDHFGCREYTKDNVRGARRRYKKGESAPETFDERVQREQAKFASLQAEKPQAEAARETAFSGLLLGVLENSITPLKFTQPPYKPPKPATRKPEDAVLVLSDWHFGKKTPLYNMGIAAERFRMICRKVRDIIELHRHATPINKLHIIWAGDMIDGTSIYPTHPHHICANTVGQIFGILPVLAGELANVAGGFKEVHNYCVRGNHGRVSKYAHEDDNFDRVLAEALRIATTNVPNMDWRIPDGWYLQAKIGGLDFLVTHGDQIKMHMNLPWYGITTRLSRWKTTDQLGGFDVLVMGHFHSSSHLRWNNAVIKVNGTAGSGDEFALEKIGLESSESQWLFGVSDTRITWNYELDFKD